MKPILTLEESGKLDRFLIDKYSLEPKDLIDGAALGAFRLIRDKLLSKKVVFAIGKGNNGSDGLELARLIAKENPRVCLFFLSDEGNDENLRRREELSFLGRVFSLTGYDVIVDCLFGFGFHGTLDQYTASVINEINQSSSYVISLDTPSALAVNADETIVFTTPKLELLFPPSRSQFGKLEYINPGFPEDELKKALSDAILIDDNDQERDSIGISDYKNTRGHVCILGGSRRFPGAPVLSARGAFKAGAGLVTLVTDPYVESMAFSSYPSIILASKPSSFDQYSSIVIGPGWDEGDEALFDLALSSGKRVVVDADGLKMLGKRSLKYKGVITPHIGEYRRLCASLSIPDGLNSAKALQKALRTVSRTLECVIVLKSSVIWICDGDRVFIYDGVNPSLGVAGSGDVLSGIIGAFLSRSEDILASAINGVIAHQRAGAIAHEKYGYYMAEDLVEEIRI